MQVAVCAKARSVSCDSPGKILFEKLVQGSKVYIFGGGHVAQGGGSLRLQGSI